MEDARPIEFAGQNNSQENEAGSHPDVTLSMYDKKLLVPFHSSAPKIAGAFPKKRGTK
jgi:hypothetical protein